MNRHFHWDILFCGEKPTHKSKYSKCNHCKINNIYWHIWCKKYVICVYVIMILKIYHEWWSQTNFRSALKCEQKIFYWISKPRVHVHVYPNILKLSHNINCWNTLIFLFFYFFAIHKSKIFRDTKECTTEWNLTIHF